MAFHDLLFAAQVPVSIDAAYRAIPRGFVAEHGGAGSIRIDDGFVRVASRLARLKMRRAIRSFAANALRAFRAGL